MDRFGTDISQDYTEVVSSGVHTSEPPTPGERFLHWLASKALRLAHTMARLAPTTTIDVFTTMPDALHAVAGALRDRLLDLALHVAEAAPRHLDHLLKAMVRLMQELPEAEQELLLGQCLRVALVDAEAGTLLCEHLPGVLEPLGGEGRRGLGRSGPGGIAGQSGRRPGLFCP